ncbi:hypothetical protein [Sinorhizobium meliloti]|uniref:hypothetical protein n=1 Tax=Rhizobium meliloti TaxID=382 RepID=UPI00399A2561
MGDVFRFTLKINKGRYTTCLERANDIDSSSKPQSVMTIGRRLSAITWNYGQCGLSLDRKDRHIAPLPGCATFTPPGQRK